MTTPLLANFNKPLLLSVPPRVWVVQGRPKRKQQALVKGAASSPPGQGMDAHLGGCTPRGFSGRYRASTLGSVQ